MALAINMELCLPRDTATVPLIRHVVTAILTEFGVTAECIGDVQLAITEACSNVVEHAGGDDEYELTISISPDRCEMRVVDQGHGFDFESLAGRDGDLESERGRGIAVMQAVVDQVRFESVPERGTVVHLVKELQFDVAPLVPRR